LLLVKAFLIFAAFRSFALLTDKDATLTTIPSFSVLLLLVPVHKGIEVVVYFVLWTLVAATLFALEHRGEQASSVVATVSGATPGHSGRLAARSLATVLMFSVGGALAFSAWLTSRDPGERTGTEVAINSLVSRLTAFALGTNNNAISGGPERQIDFSSGPALPTRSELWRTHARTLDDKVIVPTYWRLFTLSNYAGNSWSQTTGAQKTVVRDVLERADWPRPAPRNSSVYNESGRFTFQTNVPRRFFRRRGFAFLNAHPTLASQFGPNTAWVFQQLESRVANLGFAPLLPAPRSLILRGSEQEQVRARFDGSVDISIIQPGQSMFAFSNVPQLEEVRFQGQTCAYEANRADAPESGALARRTPPQSLASRQRSSAREGVGGASHARRGARRKQLRARVAIGARNSTGQHLHVAPARDSRTTGSRRFLSL
jgi:hypothetical protein